MTTKAHDASLNEYPPPDPAKLVLGAAELAFMKRSTGIQDAEALRQHIIAVQEKAYSVHPYPCIHMFSFLLIRVTKPAAYGHILKLGRERPGVLFLDIGCCFGTDSRKLVDDGFPASQVVASDYHADFWDLGNALFKTTNNKCGIRFISGDVFSDSVIDASGTPLTAPPTSLAQVDSLTPLLGHITAIYASSFFHLFSEERQRLLARRLFALLRPQSGSVIFGSHVAMKSTGMLKGSKGSMFCHRPCGSPSARRRA
ncbi:hypothetical protein AURDEDRAFT_62737 [Auricularia subglabra TFB-10046 SS5]|nr:hypothetical protein AURDEDRAFT_62737 [Auricularia subglabra TFB-10046 SS5]